MENVLLELTSSEYQLIGKGNAAEYGKYGIRTDLFKLVYDAPRFDGLPEASYFEHPTCSKNIIVDLKASRLLYPFNPPALAVLATLTAPELELLKKTMAVKDIRNYLMGVNVTKNYKDIVSSDGHRLTKIHVEDGDFSKLQSDVLIPRAIIDVFKYALKLSISDDGGTLVLRCDKKGFTVYVELDKLEQFRYFDYPRVIPEDTGGGLAMEITKAMVDECSRAIKMQKASGGGLAMEITKAMVDECSRAIKMQKASGGGLAIVDVQIIQDNNYGFNANYLLDFYKAATKFKGVWNLNQRTAADALAARLGRVTHIIMPLRQ